MAASKELSSAETDSVNLKLTGGRVLRDAELVLEMVATPAPYRRAIIEKVRVLQDCMDQGHGWSDNPDRLLARSAAKCSPPPASCTLDPWPQLGFPYGIR